MGIANLLLLILFIGAWIATFRLDTHIGISLRRNLWCVAFAFVLLLTFHNHGKKRAFGLGMLIPFLLYGLPKNWPLSHYRPDFGFAPDVAPLFADTLPPDRQITAAFFFSDTISLVGMLALALICGVASTVIWTKAGESSPLR